MAADLALRDLFAEALLGKREAARQTIDMLTEPFLGIDPRWDGLRNEPRFQSIARHLKL